MLLLLIFGVLFAGIMWALCIAASLFREEGEDEEQETWIREWLKEEEKQ